MSLTFYHFFIICCLNLRTFLIAQIDVKSQSDVLISEEDNCSDDDLDVASLINDDLNVNNNLTTNNVANLDAMTLEEKCLLPLPFNPSGGGGYTNKPSIHCYSMSSSTDNCSYLHLYLLFLL